jgi:hypothetical protein
MRYRSPEEFIQLHGAELTAAWLRVVLRQLGALQDPPVSPPKHPYFDATGWVQLPPEWTWVDLPPITVVFRRLALKRWPAIQHAITPDRTTLGQAQFEDALGLVAGRLSAPYAGKLRFELHDPKRRVHAKDYDAVIDWAWPQKAS